MCCRLVVHVVAYSFGNSDAAKECGQANSRRMIVYCDCVPTSEELLCYLCVPKTARTVGHLGATLITTKVLTGK